MVKQFLCFTSLPDVNQLLYTFATLNKQEESKTSQYNLTILKCRQLLFENSFVLACPNLEGVFGIYVVAKESYFKDGTLAEYFKKRNLKPGQPSILYKHIYEECCYYTITAKLAPKWNLISNYLVRGRDFLTETNAIDAIHLTININNKGDTSFGFQISRIKLPAMTVDKLDIHNAKLGELYRRSVVHLKKNESKMIRVLPSLKRANIVSISKRIQENCAIKNYQEMRRHWKNTYGYRLPESDNGIFYVEVSFFDGSMVFTYPSLCVRPYEPVFMQRVDPGPVVSVFMADLLKTVPSILGDVYKVPTHLSEPSHELNVVSQATPYPNASEIENRPEPKYRQNISATQNSAFALVPTQKHPPQTSKTDKRSKLTQLVSELAKSENKTSKYITQKTSCSPHMSPTQTTQQYNLQSVRTTVVENIIQQNYTSTSYKDIVSERSSFNYTPVFGQPKINGNNDNVNKNSAVQQQLKCQMNYLNNFIAQKEKSNQISAKNNENNQNLAPGNGTRFVPTFTPKFPVRKHTTNIVKQKTGTSKVGKLNSIQNKENLTSSNKLNLESILTNPTKVDKTLTSKSTVAETPVKYKKQPAFIMNQIKEIAKSTQHTIEVPDIANLQVKRKNPCDSPALKKQKTKTMEVTNMADYVRNNTLDNLTVPTLINWLKENSVKCNAKEKKSDLIQKVLKLHEK